MIGCSIIMIVRFSGIPLRLPAISPEGSLANGRRANTIATIKILAIFYPFSQFCKIIQQT